jgi:hypothetical protein
MTKKKHLGASLGREHGENAGAAANVKHNLATEKVRVVHDGVPAITSTQQTAHTTISIHSSDARGDDNTCVAADVRR